MKVGDKYYCKKEYYGFGREVFHKNIIYCVELVFLHFNSSKLYKVYEVYFRDSQRNLYYFRTDINFYDYFESSREVRKKKLNKLSSISIL